MAVGDHQLKEAQASLSAGHVVELTAIQPNSATSIKLGWEVGYILVRCFHCCFVIRKYIFNNKAVETLIQHVQLSFELLLILSINNLNFFGQLLKRCFIQVSQWPTGLILYLSLVHMIY